MTPHRPEMHQLQKTGLVTILIAYILHVITLFLHNFRRLVSFSGNNRNWSMLLRRTLKAREMRVNALNLVV
jgi:hypothetical protein